MARAGVVVTGREAAGPRILASECFLFPNSLDAMGFDLRDSGFHIVLSKDVPQLIRERVRGTGRGIFWPARGCGREDIFPRFILHPGGQKTALLHGGRAGSYPHRHGIILGRAAPLRQSLQRQCSVHPAGVDVQARDARREVTACSWPSDRGFTAEMILLQWP